MEEAGWASRWENGVGRDEAVAEDAEVGEVEAASREPSTGFSAAPLELLRVLCQRELQQTPTQPFQIRTGGLGNPDNGEQGGSPFSSLKAKLSRHFPATPRVTCPNSRRRAGSLVNKSLFTGHG